MSTDQHTPRPEALLTSVPVPGSTLERLHRRLEDAAAAVGVLDVAYTTLETPVGTLLLAATERGLVRVAYAREDHEKVLADLADRLGPRILHAPARLEPAVEQLREYFAGTRTRFDLPLDRSLSRGFRRLVQEHLPGIDYGSTQSYSAVARSVGRPQAVRAVGTACATNPLPVVVPCHRVLRGDGGLGGYIGGLEAKSVLLELEAAA
ncbi:methylated-DNA--[protein]-cysteine S-methyltransferase [Kocuria turfanensis]|uniref:methylated-DNA--[protein]-cysteine S-methyltransferase n=1 Tax=Kocuria turfanensis TaxID=388357 RepID=A0A512IDA3_9MICC|nr:methylated-DNA--[protein]-cysteine S-methyltransferase [Kocuria turfanensis]GEO95683.1 methylated-DNA--protein-cysteine methyltransferase [Kocuria turfanensis]